ncbi:MAG TPA: AraC family ligand binding domain-containing protein [Gemmatimonadaceae bacterium]
MNTYEPLALAADATSAQSDRPASAIMHEGPDVRLVVFRIEPGQSVAPHVSASTVILSVVEGSGLVSGAEGERSVRAGDVVTYARSELHGMRALSHLFVVVAIIAPSPGVAERNRPVH